MNIVGKEFTIKLTPSQQRKWYMGEWYNGKKCKCTNVYQTTKWLHGERIPYDQYCFEVKGMGNIWRMFNPKIFRAVKCKYGIV
jgi:hypothetical protein